MKAIKAWLFLGAIQLASALTCAQIGHASQAAGRPSAQAVGVADAFLLAVEQGRLDAAHAMLALEARDAFNRNQLAPRRPMGQRGGFIRRYSSSAEVSESAAYSGWGQPRGRRSAYRIICYVERPSRGFGAVRYVSVIVGNVFRDQVWVPLIYRIESSRNVHCPS